MCYETQVRAAQVTDSGYSSTSKWPGSGAVTGFWLLSIHKEVGMSLLNSRSDWVCDTTSVTHLYCSPSISVTIKWRGIFTTAAVWIIQGSVAVRQGWGNTWDEDMLRGQSPNGTGFLITGKVTQRYRRAYQHCRYLRNAGGGALPHRTGMEWKKHQDNLSAAWHDMLWTCTGCPR